MRKHLLAVACLAALGVASSASAATILNYGQTSPTDGVKTGNTVGSTTTITVSSTSSPGFIPVTLTTLGGTSGLSLAAFEQFTNVTSTGAATVTSGQISQTYSGTITFYSAANIASPRFLQITFTGAVLSGAVGGNSATLQGSVPPNSVNFASDSGLVTPFLVGDFRNFAIGLSGVSNLGVTGTALNSFTSTGEGGSAAITAIPEPTAIIPSSMALLAGLGCYGWRRRKSA